MNAIGHSLDPTRARPAPGSSTLPAGSEPNPGLTGDRSGRWTVVSVGAAGVAQLGLVVVLSRLLDGAEMGLAAALIALLSLPRMLMDSILSAPIIQRADLDRSVAAAAATLAVLVATATGLVLWLLSGLIEVGFGIDGLSSLVRWVAPILPLIGLATAPQALLQRRLDFRSMAIIDVVSLLGGYLVIGVTAAVLGVGALAVVIAFAAEGVLRVVLAQTRSPLLPTLRPDRSELADVARFASSTGAGSLLNLLATRGDYLVVSRVAGPIALAAYTQAYQLAYNPGLVLSRVMNRWLFPLLSSSRQSDEHAEEQVVLANLRRLGLLTGGVAVAVAVLAPDMVRFLLGSRWSDAILPLQIMAVALPARVMHSVHDAQIKAAGLVDRRAVIQGMYAAAVIVLVLVGARMSLVWAAVGLVVAIHVNYFLMARLGSRSIGLGVGRLMQAHLPVLTGAAATAAVLIPTVALVRLFTSSPFIVLAAAGFALVAALGLGVLAATSAREQEEPPDLVPTERAVSPTVSDLLTAFRAAGVRTVFFKGRHGLDRALGADSDLDLFVLPDHRALAGSILADRGFVPAPDARWSTDSYLVDYFGAGHDGRIVHVQLHHRAVVGVPGGPIVHVSGVDRLVAEAEAGLGWESDGDDVLVAADRHGAVIRLCDAVLRPTRSRASRVDLALGLCRQVPIDEIGVAADDLFGDDAITAAATAMISGAGPEAGSERLRRALVADPRIVLGQERRSVRVVRAGLAKLNRRTLRRPILPRRRLERAPVVAIIGSDGAGKSTVTSGMTDQLGAKIDARLFYLGTGDGPASLVRLPLVWLRRLWDRSSSATDLAPRPDGAPNPATDTGPDRSGRKRTVPEPARLAWAISTVFERRAKLRRARRAAGRGFVVICDRYPQAEIVGMFDGPRLRDGESLSALGRAVSRWERRNYEAMAASRPDLVVLLDVGVETAMRRRPEERREELELRTATARQLRYGGAPRRVVDAEQGPDEVLAQVMSHVLQACRPGGHDSTEGGSDVRPQA